MPRRLRFVSAPKEPPARDLSAQENADLCAGCVQCCTYITVQVDSPRASWEYDQWIWALYHRGVSLYVEKPEAWYVHFEARCDHLNAAGKCSIHGRHPVLCRDYDPRHCERRLPLSDIVAWFHTGDELEAWLQRHRPAHHRKLEEYRGRMPQGPPRAGAHPRTAPALLQIAEPARPNDDPLATGLAAATPSPRRRIRT